MLKLRNVELTTIKGVSSIQTTDLTKEGYVFDDEVKVDKELPEVKEDKELLVE